jgi:tRNA(Ile)-lysidine synthase
LMSDTIMPGIKLLGTLPQEPFWLAVSGGIDSVAVWDFLRRSRSVRLAFFDHGTPNSHRAREFIESDPQFRDCEIRVGHTHNDKHDDQSWEEFWRLQRYQFLSTLDGPVITAHHLDDCIETYVWRMCHGRGDTIPYRRNNVIRPFLLTPKQSFRDWCIRHQLRWIEDVSNADVRYTRNHIRHRVIPELLRVNPGLAKTVHKLVLNQYQNNLKS